MPRLEMKNYNMILTEKQQKYQHYHPEKLIIMNMLQVNKQCLLIKKKSAKFKKVKHAKFTYSPLGKALQIQIKTIKNRGKKQIKAIEGHRKQLLKSYELIKKDFNINRDNV